MAISQSCRIGAKISVSKLSKLSPMEYIPSLTIASVYGTYNSGHLHLLLLNIIPLILNDFFWGDDQKISVSERASNGLILQNMSGIYENIYSDSLCLHDSNSMGEIHSPLEIFILLSLMSGSRDHIIKLLSRMLSHYRV